jgi:hypothetical protein
MNIKRSMLVGATIATVATGIGGVGLASADTMNAGKPSDTSIVDKLASRFNLNKSDIQAVFDEDKATHVAHMETDQKQRVADAVTAGKLTQAQADHINAVLDELKALRGNTDPHDLSDSAKEQFKTKMDELRQWADDNNINTEYVMPMGDHGHGMGDGSKPSDMSSSSTEN